MSGVRAVKPTIAAAVFNVDDGADNIRLECLKMALQVGANDMPTLIANAQSFLDFVRPRRAAVDVADLFPKVSP